MARGRKPQLTAPPEETIPKVLSECQRTTAVHKRSVGLLQQCRRDFPAAFCSEFVRCITPALLVYKQEPAVTRTINFIATFASAQDTVGPQDASDDFVEELLGFLLDSTQSRDKALRYRSTQLVAKIIELLPEDAGISDEVWEGVCEHMQARLRDKQPVIRAKAAQALARLVEPGEDGSFEDDPITSAYKVLLTNDKNSDVRKAVVASYPMAEPLLPDVIERTRDVSDAVRRVTYIALRTKLYVSRLTLQQRVDLLRRGLSDRAPAVRTECVKMVCDYWYVRDCESDPLALIDLLHVEEETEEEDGQWSHEEVAERVLLELLRGGHATLEKGASLRDYLQAPDTRGGRTPGLGSPRSILSPGPVSPPSGGATAAAVDAELPSEGPVLMSPSEALYWRVNCQWLHKQAETQGRDAANSGGGQAEVLAAEADESRALLEGFLPATVAEFVELTRMHLAGGADHRFAARQLMALAGCLDLTDAAGRRAAAGLVQALLCGSATYPHGSPLNTPPKSPANPLGDCQDAAGPDLGTDRKWAHAVSTLARHVHAAPGEYVATLFAAVQELDRRAEDVEGTADGEAAGEEARLRCLAVAALLLEAVKGLPELREADARATAVLEQAVAAQVHHASPHVRSAALRCLALLCHLDGGLSQQFSPLLCAAAQNEAFPAARLVALKALFDVALRHGPDCLNSETIVEQGPTLGRATGHPGESSPGSAAESFQSALSSRGTSFRSAVSGIQAEELMETAQSPLPRGRPAQDGSTVTGEAPARNGAPNSDPLAFLAQFLDPAADTPGGGASEKGGKRPKSGKGKKGPGKKRGDVGAGREAVEVAAEGFAKLLLFDRVPRPGAPLAQLLLLHFDAVTEPLLRLRQCLAVFFDYYAASAAEHKRSISGAFLDVVRLAWTGHALDGKLTSAAARKRAATAAKFMLHLLQQPPLHQPKPAAAPTPDPTSEDEAASAQTVDPAPRGIPPTEDEGQEQLALDLAAEILGCPDKRSAGGKAYVSMLARSVAGLTFRRSEQEAIKRMRKLLDWLRDVLQFDKAVSKELAAMATRLAHLDDTPAEPLSDEALRSLQALAEAHARAADEDAEDRPHSRAKRTSKVAASDTTAVRSSNDEVTANRPDDVSSDKRRTVRRPTRQSKTAALTRMGDQKKAAFAGDTDSSHEAEDSGSEAFEGEDEGAASHGARTSQRHVGRDGGGSDSDEGSDDETAEGRSGGVQKQQVQGGRRDSAGSAAGSEHGQGSRAQGVPQESDAGEGESDEDSGEPAAMAAEERGSTERLSGRVSGSVTSEAEESDDVSGAMRAGRPRRSAAFRERRRRLVLEESSDEESGQGSAGEEERNESERLTFQSRSESRVTVSDSPKGAEKENASSDEDSDEVAPVVVRRKTSTKRKVVLDSSEDEEEEADKGEVARHIGDANSDATSFSSAEEEELDSDSD